MSYTYTEVTGDGSTTTFSFRFAGYDKGYIRASDIHVEWLDGSNWVEATGWVLSGTNQITFNVAPASGRKMRIRRIVDKDNPYAVFDRNVVLDMKSLNNNFIQQLEIIQELLDGFLPDGYFMKNHLNMGVNRITNLGAGVEATDAVNKGQLDSLDKKHTDWNKAQDLEIAGLKKGMTSGVSHRTIPWYMVASGGEQIIRPPYEFEDAMVFINGVFQHELAGAVSVGHDVISLSEPLQAGDELYVLIGSRLTPPTAGDTTLMHQQVSEGTQSIDIVTAFKRLDVYLDGLHQPDDAYEVHGSTVTFSEPLPECTVTFKLQLV